MAGPFVSFLSDFGADTAPAVCRGVIWSIAPEARICDLTHTVRRHAIRDGAFLLSVSLPYLPIGVHLAVVDPGVGTARQPIAILTGRGDLLVGPDNGLLTLAALRLGGIDAVRVLENRGLWRPDVSSTFHGRDLFAPVAAHLAAGVPFADVGPPVEPADIVGLDLPEPIQRDEGIDTSVLFIDSFGNCRLAGSSADLGPGTSPEPGSRFRAGLPGREINVAWVPTFGEVPRGAPLLYEDADYAGLALAINQGSAAEEFGLSLDTPVSIRRA